jgi:hypothetical protein
MLKKGAFRIFWYGMLQRPFDPLQSPFDPSPPLVRAQLPYKINTPYQNNVGVDQKGGEPIARI